ncbi:MAG: pyridoxamine 5'-phosphate oxidase [Bacteroidota bacterium]
MHPSTIANLRVDYSLQSFDEKDLKNNPFDQFAQWMEDAIKAEVNEPNAMTLATVKEDGSPAARIVLLKGFDERGFTFYTNYDSNKGQEIQSNHKVALVFCWLELQRQVRVEGIATRVSAAESDAYFKSRPYGSQVGAHASPQSTSLQSRAELENMYAHFEKLFKEEPIMRPEHWGGFIINPHKIEFWQGRTSRLHDRFLFTKQGNNWDSQRLAP